MIHTRREDRFYYLAALRHFWGWFNGNGNRNRATGHANGRRLADDDHPDSEELAETADYTIGDR